MKLHRRSVFHVLALWALMVAAHPIAAQKKGGNPPPPQHWPCTVTFRDAVDAAGNFVDGILSDGRGSYVDGEDGGRVSCRIIQDPTTAHDGWLALWIDAASIRYIDYPGQQAITEYTRPGYATIHNRGSFEVKKIRDASILDQAYLQPFRSYLYNSQFSRGEARLVGDSFGPAPTTALATDLRGTSSLIVVPADPCTWNVTSDPDYPLAAGEGAEQPRRLRVIESGKAGRPINAADFVISFSATVRIIGVKPGCTPN